MNWLVLILAFSVAVLMGAFLANLLERTRPRWTARRQLWAAASALPIFILLATLIGLAWILVSGPGAGENMQDLALVVTGAIGVLFAGVALVGGLVGGSFAQRSKQE
jgi:hypothetical protein